MIQLTGKFLLCAFLATITSPIVADYVIDVKLIKFENYNRLLANGRTCSNFRNQQCQTTLHICARPDDSSTLCSYGKTKTGVIGDNVIDLNRTFVGMIKNPITYQITEPFQKFVVSFTAKNNDELIAEYVYHSGSHLPQRSVEEARYELITTRGIQNPTTQLTYQIRSYCSQGYYGPHCITRCYIPIAEQTRFECDINGKKVCKPGLSGPLCNIHADQCHSSPCKNGATCTPMGTTFKCYCQPGYTGQYCNKGTDECSLTTTPCLNGGICVDGVNRYYCRCEAGYTGPRCEIAISACSSSPCMNGGQCSNAGTSFVCHCLPNFYGNRCQIEDKCRSVTCQNGGRCQIVNNQIACICPNGFYGDRCQFSNHLCYPKCQNGGTCNSNTRICDCPQGFVGRDCSRRDLCASNPNVCQNGGSCQLVNDQITCACLNGFYGDRCQFSNLCYPNCKNGGTCNINTRICDCPQGFGGRDCSTRDPCASKPCRNNGQCFVSNNFDYRCVCRQGWTGKNCENTITTCSVNPCLHGGQCYPLGNGFACKCPQGWTGQRCDISTDACIPNPCQNNGQCSRYGPNGFICNCVTGWSGRFCNESSSIFYCPSRPCLNGGTCIHNTNQLFCRCPFGFKGQYCEVPDHQGSFNCSEPTGLFPDPQSCRHFYQCDWNIAQRKDCPGNLHFNNVKKVCDWPYRANCNFGK